MATLFESEAWDLCWKLGRANSYQTQISTQVPRIILHEIMHDFIDKYHGLMGFMRFKREDFASMLGLANMRGPWGLGLRVIRPLGWTRLVLTPIYIWRKRVAWKV